MNKKIDLVSLIVKYDDEQLDEHVDQFHNIIDNEFSDSDRKDKLHELYNTEPFKEQLRVAPASSVGHFHNAFIGGYCLHVMNVIKFSKQLFSFYKANGGNIDFELEELVFAAMHHDLGKLGDENGAHFIINEDNWSVQKRNMFFKINPNLQRMDPGTRGFYILSQFGITYSWKEMLGIRLADGLYEDCNREYLLQFNEEKQLKTNLPYILHSADFMASRIENDDYKRSVNGESDVLDSIVGG